MASFKVKINFKNHFDIGYVSAIDEVDACWEAKKLAESHKGMVSFDLMSAE